MLYNELEYCYIAFFLLHRGDTPYHELSVYGIHVWYIILYVILYGYSFCSLNITLGSDRPASLPKVWGVCPRNAPVTPQTLGSVAALALPKVWGVLIR